MVPAGVTKASLAGEFFFFQAEDGIRGTSVTGVQTCALPILAVREPGPVEVVSGDRDLFQLVDDAKPVRLLYCGRGVAKLEVFDDTAVRAKYGVPASDRKSVV